jgi:3-keto-disaccharide hydrolase
VPNSLTPMSLLHAVAGCVVASIALAQTPATQRPTGPPPGSPPPGSRCLGCGTAPEPIDNTDRTGWTQIFDGKTLTNWDGNPEVWRVEDGAITAANWPERRIGTTYIIWRGGEPGDFELKLEVKADYDVHGGIFYRSTIGAEPTRAGGAGSARGAPPAGAPRPQPAPPAVPADPKWNARGYGIDWDYDPGNNGNIQDPGAGRTDTQIVWRGHIVRTENGKRPRSIGTLGDRDALMKFISLDDWNQIHIIAHGHQLTHIVNGHVMAVLIDDDQAAVKTKGYIALQIEQYGAGKISFRNIWLKQ